MIVRPLTTEKRQAVWALAHPKYGITATTNNFMYAAFVREEDALLCIATLEAAKKKEYPTEKGPWYRLVEIVKYD